MDLPPHPCLPDQAQSAVMQHTAEVTKITWSEVIGRIVPFR